MESLEGSIGVPDYIYSKIASKRKEKMGIKREINGMKKRKSRDRKRIRRVARARVCKSDPEVSHQVNREEYKYGVLYIEVHR